jgi:hypothetical protein
MSDDQELITVHGRHADVDPQLEPDADRTADLTADLDRTGFEHRPGAAALLTADDLVAAGPYPEPPDAELDSDPFADDLDGELAARATRRLANRTTTALLAALLLVGGFLAGAQAQKHWGSAASPAAAGGGTGANPAGGNAANAANGGAGATGRTGTAGTTSTTGTVKLVDGTTVYLQLANGDVVTVKTSGATSVQTVQTGSLAQLAPGTQVTVEGQSGGTGIVLASRLTIAR